MTVASVHSDVLAVDINVEPGIAVRNKDRKLWAGHSEGALSQSCVADDQMNLSII